MIIIDLLATSLPTVDEYMQRVITPDAGGVASFVGVTRNNFNGLKVERLEYEAYEPMAKKTMQELAEGALKQFGLLGVVVAHRLGPVPISEASVVIVTTSAHRKEALAACQFLIDEVKASVPIWKKEHYVDESAPPQWKSNCEGCARKQNNSALHS